MAALRHPIYIHICNFSERRSVVKGESFNYEIIKAYDFKANVLGILFRSQIFLIFFYLFII